MTDKKLKEMRKELLHVIACISRYKEDKNKKNNFLLDAANMHTRVVVGKLTDMIIEAEEEEEPFNIDNDDGVSFSSVCAEDGSNASDTEDEFFSAGETYE